MDLGDYERESVIIVINGAGARNRTEMPLRAGDFESPASTSFTTPARSAII